MEMVHFLFSRSSNEDREKKSGKWMQMKAEEISEMKQNFGRSGCAITLPLPTPSSTPIVGPLPSSTRRSCLTRLPRLFVTFYFSFRAFPPP